uniref:Benzoate 4-monooxygenase cytochrome p450 n=1 Tax=Moniliophthora roreri TaxID=221103 RepID=A0A0W0FRE1_MONRR
MELLNTAYVLPFIVFVSLSWLGILFSDPLKRFPGPLLAKWTRFYRVYYDVVVSGGWFAQLQHLHRVYGPVVRLHFSDLSAYTDIYSSPAKLPKDPHLYKCFEFGYPSSVFTEVDPKAHAVLKTMLGSFFSRQGIVKLENVIQEQIDKLISQLAKNHKNTPANMNHAFRSTTLDIITKYTFRADLDMTSYPSFEHPILHSLNERSSTLWVFKHFPFLVSIIKSLPPWLAEILMPSSVPQLEVMEQISQLVDEAMRSTSAQDAEEYEGEDKNVFYTVIRNARTKHQYQITREYLISEGLDLRIAGSDTVGNTCAIGTRHLVNDARVRGKLQAELDEVWSDKDVPLKLEKLEKLPYLTAVIKESLRLSHGVVTPMSRIVSEAGVIIASHEVPPGTVVSIANPFVHLNSDVFPDPERFYPERWIEAKGYEADRYLVPFGKGPRSCLGINLAWSEMYMILGNIFRRLELRSDCDLGEKLKFRDFFGPVWEGDVLSATVVERQS